ncbi:hypothetical protein [Microbacterium paludicola]|nr:hypothetical protein [Microbacterium paludicola]
MKAPSLFGEGGSLRLEHCFLTLAVRQRFCTAVAVGFFTEKD